MVVLELEGGVSVLSKFCPGDVVKYSCTSVFMGNSPTLTWEIALPGQPTRSVTFSGSSQIGMVIEVLDAVAILTEYNVEGLMSNLLLTRNSDNNMFQAQVSCATNSLSPVSDNFQSVLEDEGIV